MDLAANQKRIHYRSKIIDRNVAQNFNYTGFFIDLDFTNMAAVGEGPGLGRIMCPSIQARVHAGIGKVAWVLSHPCQLGKVDAVSATAGDHQTSRSSLALDAFDLVTHLLGEPDEIWAAHAGPLPVSVVSAADDLPLGADGRHVFPPGFPPPADPAG